MGYCRRVNLLFLLIPTFKKEKVYIVILPYVHMLELKRKIGPKGQIVLPKDVRKQFNLHTGSEVTFRVEDSKIVLQPLFNTRDYVEDFCSLGKGLKKLTMKELKNLQEEQYA